MLGGFIWLRGVLPEGLSPSLSTSWRDRRRAQSAALVTLLTLALVPVFVSPQITVSNAFASGQRANLVLGQDDFASTFSGSSIAGLFFPSQVAFDNVGNLWVTDEMNDRIVEYQRVLSAFLPSISIGVGRGTTLNSLAGPHGIAFDAAGNLWVADSSNNRVLKFSAPLSNSENASLVLGQTDFNSQTCSSIRSGLCHPMDVAIDSSGNIWVDDSGNNRILGFAATAGSGALATTVIGQPSFGTNRCGLTPRGICGAGHLAFDAAGSLWLSDSGNNRVLRYSKPFTTGMAASLVIGQVDLFSRSSSSTASGLAGPSGISFDSAGALWVADSLNNRILMFPAPLGNHTSATLVVGRPALNSPPVHCSPSQTTNCSPQDAIIDASGNLWVADSTDNRVLRFYGGRTFASVTCDKTTILVGRSTVCSVLVHGESPKGSVSWSAASGRASFTPTTCTVVSAECKVRVKVTTLGAVVINAKYSGDADNLGSTGAKTLDSEPMTVVCSKATLRVGGVTVCKAEIARPPATGAVIWHSSKPGRFTNLPCRLSLSSCTVTFTPTSASPSVVISASYLGDRYHARNLADFTVVAKRFVTSITASCQPDRTSFGNSFTFPCTARVTGYHPTGTIIWSIAGQNPASLTTNACLVGAGSCKVIAVSPTSVIPQVVAVYLGDPNNTSVASDVNE